MTAGPDSQYWSALPPRSRAVLPLRVFGLFLAAWMFPGLAEALAGFLDYARRSPWEPEAAAGYFSVIERILGSYFRALRADDATRLACMTFGFVLGLMLVFSRRLFWALLRRFPR